MKETELALTFCFRTCTTFNFKNKGALHCFVLFFNNKVGGGRDQNESSKFVSSQNILQCFITNYAEIQPTQLDV